MIKISKFGSLEEANYKLRGGLVGGKVIPSVAGLTGKAITFTAPAGSHTFTAGAVPGVHSFAEIKAQLEGAITNLLVRITSQGRIVFLHATDGQVVSLAAADQPARALLGLANEAGAGTAISGRYVNSDGTTAPYFVAMNVENGQVFLAVEE